MKAAVVASFDHAPFYREFDDPVPQPGEVVVSVRAAALSQLVRSQAAGKHYSHRAVGFVPGADGVGTLENGQRVYFAFPRAPFGSMAERSVVKQEYCVLLPDALEDVTAAALANPAMSSWAALTHRAGLKAGESVLINGATGASGRLAIQIAKFLGAHRVIATGRNSSSESAMRDLGADVYIALDSPSETLTQTFRDEMKRGLDVVLDYLWGASAEHLISAATGHGAGEAAHRIRFVQIGSLSGGSISLPGAALRSSGLELLGSGLGSVSHTALVSSISSLMAVAVSAGLKVDAEPAPLSSVESAWTGSASGRLVFTM